MVLPEDLEMNIRFPVLGQHGRLGNQMWQIASTVGIARSHDAEPQFHHWEYEPFFTIPPEMFVDEPSGADVTEYVPHIKEMADKLCLQDYGLWSAVEDEVRAMFRPSRLALQQLQEYQWFYELDNKCCLHVRRDERVRIDVLRHTHPIPPLDYYLDAIDFLGRDAFNYVVFSDDIGWCRKAFGPKFTYVEGYPRRQETYGDPDEPEIRDHLDLFLMTSCVQHVIPNSTYSWWGAFLANKNSPIYPDPWYGPGLAHVDATLQFPWHWIKREW